mgnify:CR=1 FL=1
MEAKNALIEQFERMSKFETEARQAGFEMIEIGRIRELDKASHYPKEVQEKILEDVEIIANEYGDNNQRRL